MKDARSILPFGLRMSDQTKEAIRLAAFKNRRSMNSEVIERLESSLNKEGWIETAKESLKELR